MTNEPLVTAVVILNRVKVVRYENGFRHYGGHLVPCILCGVLPYCHAHWCVVLFWEQYWFLLGVTVIMWRWHVLGAVRFISHPCVCVCVWVCVCVRASVCYLYGCVYACVKFSSASYVAKV